MTNRILIVGASGFLGNTIYKEVLPYFDVYGTYATQDGLFAGNQVFYRYVAETDSIIPILQKVKPSIVISAFKSHPNALLETHRILCQYVHGISGKLIFLSSAEVFSAKGDFPAYETDTPLSESLEGKTKISLEKLVTKLPKHNYALLRLPLVLGVNSPNTFHLKQAIKHHASFEVFPNAIVSATTSDKMAQQIHYIINQELTGTFHLASQDVIHHDELFREISERLSHKKPIFKNVFSSNEDRYQAILPKHNVLPKAYQITIQEVIADSTLKDEIVTLKH
ncbi:MAG: sugar nucleotide-binding protein [Flavobacteriaceae bacterium]